MFDNTWKVVKHIASQQLYFGNITNINADGTYDVNIKSRRFDYKNVIDTSNSGLLSIGDSVVVALNNSDPQKPFITKRSNFYSGGT